MINCKRFISIILAFVLLLGGALAAYAGTSSWHIKEVGITIGIPDNYIVLSRDNLNSHANLLKALGLSASSMKQFMIQEGIFLECLSDDYTKEIVVASTSANLSNFCNLSDDYVIAQVSVFKEQYASSGIDLYKADVYQNDHAKYAICFMKGTSGYGMEYYTVYNGKAISITFNNYLGSFSTTDISKCKKIIDAIQFDNPPINAPMESRPSFLFTDKETGTTFTVPENWKETSFSKPHEGLDNMFSSTVDPVVSIMYGSTDIYPQSVEEDPSLKREDLDISKMTESEIEDFASNLSSYNPKTDSFKKVYYNGTEYLEINRAEKKNSYGMEIVVHTVVLATMRNGYSYVFAFGEADDSPYYSDFIKLMNTVDYAELTVQPTAESVTQAPTQQTSAPADNSGNNTSAKLKPGHLMIIGFIALLLAVIISAVIINANKKRKYRNFTDKQDVDKLTHNNKLSSGNEDVSNTTQLREENSNSKAEDVTAISAIQEVPKDDNNANGYSDKQSRQDEPKPRFCHKCGAKLLPDSDFCSYCGQRIN